MLYVCGNVNIKQTRLGEALMPCFTGGETVIPCNRINMWRGQPSFIEISTAEAGSVQLEFRDLSRSSNDSRFEVCGRLKSYLFVCIANT